MRVISGTARGTKLLCQEGLSTRPTTDRIKETIFNIISNDLYDCYFLDLFSGSGAIGIEALSRASSNAFFVEYSKEACDIINANLIKTKLNNKATVINKDVLSALNNIHNKFNIVFLDPPYNENLVQPVLLSLVSNDLLKEDAIVVVEQSSDSPTLEVNGLEIFKDKKFTTTKVIFYRKYGDIQ